MAYQRMFKLAGLPISKPAKPHSVRAVTVSEFHNHIDHLREKKLSGMVPLFSPVMLCDCGWVPTMDDYGHESWCCSQPMLLRKQAG